MADDTQPDGSEPAPLKYPDITPPSEEAKRDLLEAFRQGRTQVGAAEDCGVSESLVRKWLANWPELKAKADKARKVGKKKLLSDIEKAGKKHWQAAKWLLQVRYRDEFGNTDHFTASDIQALAKAIVDRLVAKLADVPQAPDLIREAIDEALETLE